MLDTNIVIYSLGGNEKITTLINRKEHYISEITEIELPGFHNLSMDDEKVLRSYLLLTNIISLTAPVKRLAIELKKSIPFKNY